MAVSREEALRLMEEWTQSESLRKHMLAVEAAVVAYARKLGGDEETWAVAALLHDFDYERHPIADDRQQGHPFVGVAHLRELGYPQRSEEHTSELQSRENLVCRLLLEKK